MKKEIRILLKVLSAIWITTLYYKWRIESMSSRFSGYVRLPVEILPPEGKEAPVYFSGLVEETGEAYMLLETYRYPSVISRDSPHGNNEKFSKLRTGYKFVIGITSDQGKSEDLLATINSVLFNIGIDEISQQDNKRFLVVIQLSDIDTKIVKNRALDLEQRYRRLVENGNMDIIIPRKTWYEGASVGRAKDTVDHAHLMLYAATKGSNYLHLSPNCKTSGSFLDKIEEFLQEVDTNFWISLSFTGLGLCGKLLRSSDLYGLVVHLNVNKNDKDSVAELYRDYVKKIHKPCDLSEILIDTTCLQELGLSDIQYRPSLFNCTYIQNVRDPNYPVQHEPYPWEDVPVYLNPKADLWTSMKVIEGHDLQNTYDLQGYFLVEKPQAGDVIYVNFTPPVVLEEFFLRSWHSGHPKARFDSTTYIDVLPVFPQIINLTNSYYFKYKSLGDGYYQVGRFNERSIAENPLGESFDKIASIRLRVTTDHHQPALIREMIFKLQVVPTTVKPCCEPYWTDPFSQGIPGYKPLDY